MIRNFESDCDNNNMVFCQDGNVGQSFEFWMYSTTIRCLLKLFQTGRRVDGRVSQIRSVPEGGFSSHSSTKFYVNVREFLKEMNLKFVSNGQIATCLILFFFVSGLQLSASAQSKTEGSVTLPADAGTNQVTETTIPSPTMVDPEERLIPDYFLASVSIDAEVVGERVMMDVAVEIVINRDTGWQRIPLRFDQANIWSRVYSGPGEEAPDLNPDPKSEGISWMLKGKGKHLLKFSMWAPYRRNIIGSRLQLALPPLSEQFDTKLKLSIPVSNVILLPSPNIDVQEVQRKTDSSVFHASVSKNRLDVLWKVPQSNANLVSKVATRFYLKPSVESLSLIADQTIELQQQDAKELVVRLPTEFELSSTEVNQSPVEEYPGRPGWVKVKLREVSSGPVVLHWEFQKILPQAGDRLVIDGLEIEGAVQEGGTIRIEGLKGYRIAPQLADSRLVYRVGLDEMQPMALDSTLSVYEYLQQPFRMVQEIRPVEPLHSVSLIHELDVRSNKIILNVHQLIEIERGAVERFRLDWPQMKEGQWKFLKTATGSLTAGEIQTSINDETETVSFRLSRPLSMGERVHLISQFERPISIDKSPLVSWTFPHAPRENARSELLTFNLEDELALEFEEASESHFLAPLNEIYLNQLIQIWPLSNRLSLLLKSPESKVLEVDDEKLYQAKITKHERELTVQSTIEIQEATPRDLLILQRFDLNIKYGRIQTIELAIPDELMELIKPVGLLAGMTVLFEGEPLDLDPISEIPRIIFPRELIGLNSVEVQYRFPLKSELQEQMLLLPVITLGLTPIDQLACLVTPIENVQLISENTGWIAAQTSPRGPLWIKEPDLESVTSIPLLVGGGLADSSQQYLVEHANLWTQFENDGRAKTLARYEILSPPSRLIMKFPPNSEFITSVDGVPLSEAAINRSSSDMQQVILNLPDGISERRILEIQYLTETDVPFSFAEQQTFQFPEFAKTVWVNETVWEVQFPFGFHLFEYPNLKPLFKWKRNGIIWERETTEQYKEERLSRIAELPGSFQFNKGFYAFRGFSPVQTIRLRVMNRSLILLIGAGFALLLGFVFYRFPVTRNVFSLVVLAFFFAVASVWYLEPLLLLLQPAIIGVLLALTATIIDVRTSQQPPDRSTIQRRKVMGGDNHSGSHSQLGEGTTKIFTPVPSGNSDLSRE